MAKPKLSVEEITRYLKSGNEFPVTRVILEADELQFLLDEIAEYKRLLCSLLAEIRTLYD